MGQAQTQIADILDSIASPQFRVSQRSVRERFTTLETNFTKKMANEEKASGIKIHQILHKMNRAQKKLLREKRMSASFMKMNNSRKRRCDQMQKKLDNVVQKHLQKQVEELLKVKQIMKRIQKSEIKQGSEWKRDNKLLTEES